MTYFNLILKSACNVYIYMRITARHNAYTL